MRIMQPQTVVRVPIRRWRTVRFAVHVVESRRHRSLGIPATPPPVKERGSFTETTARAI